MLKGIQLIYCDEILREKVFAVLERHLLAAGDPADGGSGKQAPAEV